jgi:hypothetical protein
MSYYEELGSGVHDVDVTRSFTCRYCECDNENVDGGKRGTTVYLTCAFCKEDIELDEGDDR